MKGTAQKSDVSDLVREGQEFLFEQGGLNRVSFSILGRIARMSKDKKVESLELQECDLGAAAYDFRINFVDNGLTEEEFTRFLKEYFPERPYYERVLNGISEGVGYVSLHAQNIRYSLDFFEVSREED